MRLAAFPVPVLLMLAALAASGCTSSASEPDGAGLEWPSMAVRSTPMDAFDLPGEAHVAWRNGRMGVLAGSMPGLPAHAVVDGPRLATSDLGQAWTTWSLADFQAANPFAVRYTLWDLPRLAAGEDLSPDETGHVLLELDIDARDGADSSLDLTIVGSHVESAVLSTTLDAGAPFTFTQEQVRPIPLDASPSMEPQPVSAGDALAMRGHETLLGWIRGYQDLTGMAPETVTPESLVVQRRLTADWPVSPYDGEPLRHDGPMGHFQWARCSAEDATFTGLGWDGAVVVEAFGAGCKAIAG